MYVRKVYRWGCCYNLPCHFWTDFVPDSGMHNKIFVRTGVRLQHLFDKNMCNNM